MIKPKIGKCIDCSSDSPEKRLIAKRCELHYWLHRKKVKGSTISKVSPKRKKENREYTIKRLQFLSQPGNQRCPVTGQRATEVHHMKGRIGNLLLDTKFWLAVSRDGHKKIEENPDWAKENGFSLNRI